MQQGKKEAIVRLVMDAMGVAPALAVNAAIEIAEQHWTEADTVQYGTEARDEIYGKEN